MTAVQKPDHADQGITDTDSMGDQYLTFILDGEEYAVNILQVQEIKGWDTVTPIPNTPSYMLGVINLRGAIVPVMDLRKRFNIGTISFGPTTVIIVVRISDESSEHIVGIVVDAVSEVYRFNKDDVRPPPDLGNGISTEYVSGLVAVEDKMVILLQVDRLVSLGELETPVASASDAAAED